MTKDQLRRMELEEVNAVSGIAQFQKRLPQPTEEIKGSLFFEGAGIDAP